MSCRISMGSLQILLIETTIFLSGVGWRKEDYVGEKAWCALSCSFNFFDVGNLNGPSPRGGMQKNAEMYAQHKG